MSQAATSSTFDSQVAQSGYVLVDFWASWCGPCLMLSPTLEELETSQGVKLVTVDVDKEPALAQKYNVQSLPTVIVFQDSVVKP